MTRIWPIQAHGQTWLGTLSVQVTKTLSKNLSCQHKNQLLQVSATGTGLGLREAKVTLHEHFDGSQELLWKKRKLTYGVMDKPQRQPAVADGKSVNVQVDKAMARRNTEHKPAANHPWGKMSVGKPRRAARCTVTKGKQVKADISTLRKTGHFYLALTDY